MNGQRNGKGKEYNRYGKLIYEVEYLNWKRNRKGNEYYINGKLIYEGEYLNWKRNGKGKEYDKLGKLKIEIEYLNCLKWNIKGYYKSNNIIYLLNNGKGFIKE